jgi:hypothetical protein
MCVRLFLLLNSRNFCNLTILAEYFCSGGHIFDVILIASRALENSIDTGVHARPSRNQTRSRLRYEHSVHNKSQLVNRWRVPLTCIFAPRAPCRTRTNGESWPSHCQCCRQRLFPVLIIPITCCVFEGVLRAASGAFLFNWA